MAIRVAARFQGPLMLPGQRSYDLSTHEIGFTLTLLGPDPHKNRRTPMGIIELDATMVGRESIRDYEDDIIRSISRFAGYQAHWYEGEWSRRGDLLTRYVTFPTVRHASMGAEAFMAEFLRRHPALHRHAPKRVADRSYGSGMHPEATQAGNEILLFPKFWQLDAKAKDFVFAHEIGHYVLSELGLSALIKACEAHGIDPWNTDALPFAQSNMHEAFADSFADFYLGHSELKQRYPAWEALVRQLAA